MKYVILLLTFVGVSTLSAATLQVKITDSDDNSIRLITDEKQLNRFDYYWSQKQPVNMAEKYHWRYQLLIDEPSGKSQWVYDNNGYAREISINQASVVYQLGPIRSFNKFLNKED